MGALDDLRPDEIAPLEDGGYPLETRLRDGSRVVVDAGFVGPLLQTGINRHDDGARAHLILCAGPFPDLATPATPSGQATPLIRPFEVAAQKLVADGYRRLDVLVPFARQATPAQEKWAGAGFSCRVHVAAERPNERTLSKWAADVLSEGDAEAFVLDYVGFPVATLGEVEAGTQVPAFDLGHLAFLALEEVLDAV